MALPTWPVGLPLPIGQLGSLGTDRIYEPPQETQFDDGPSRNRCRSLFDETPRKIVLRLSRPQFVTFLAFVRVSLNKGARRFLVQVRQPDGRLGLRICRIRGPVAEQDQGQTCTVSFTLAIQDW